MKTIEPFNCLIMEMHDVGTPVEGYTTLCGKKRMFNSRETVKYQAGPVMSTWWLATFSMSHVSCPACLNHPHWSLIELKYMDL